MARRSGETVIFDRGIPDCIVYALLAGTDPTPSLEAADAYRYQPRVLFLEPWSDIYETDEERIMSFDDTLSFSRTLRDVYDRCGYTLVDVPRDSIDDRATFVRMSIARFGAIGKGEAVTLRRSHEVNWRAVRNDASTHFRTGSFAEGLALVDAIGGLADAANSSSRRRPPIPRRDGA